MNASLRMTALVSAAAAALSCAPASAPPVSDLPRPLAERRPIDGVLDPSTVLAPGRGVDLVDALGAGTTVATTTLRWAFENDDADLYVALEWDDPTENAFTPPGLDDFDGVVLFLDADGDGVLEEGEGAHRLIANVYRSSYGDLHVTGGGLSDDAVGDGLGRMTWSAGKRRAEFLVPLHGGAEDGALGASSRWNVMIYDHVQVGLPSGNIGSLAGRPVPAAGDDTGAWPALPFTPPQRHARPVFPTALGGLVAFISDHENTLGEIYTFDPATGAVARVTMETGLYMDGVSLSHDRTRIAFHGAPSSTAWSEYEIYTVGADGTGLTSVTRNGILDGHPAWSPDDAEIVYASFRDGMRASLVRMTAAGTELAVLTPAGVDDNDPDWLADGRIVFKTDRFSAAPQVRIAVMDADGGNVVQLTSAAGTSDHDPTVVGSVAVFERFPKDTNYSTDPSAIYTPWDIVEARVDGSGERTLVSNGWVNWLPVADPSGRYLVYLRSVGYTDARLMTRDGEDLGRLVPGQTKIRYVDWK